MRYDIFLFFFLYLLVDQYVISYFGSMEGGFAMSNLQYYFGERIQTKPSVVVFYIGDLGDL